MSLFDVPLLTVPDERVPEAAPAVPKKPADVLDKDQQAKVRALLTGQGPHRNTAFTPAMHEVRAGAVKAMGPAELLGELQWVWRHWPGWLEQFHPALHAHAQNVSLAPLREIS